MMRRSCSTLVPYLLAVSASLVACQQQGSRDTSIDPEAGPPAATAPELPREVPLKDPAPPDSPGKPLPPIEFDYTIIGTPTLGQPVEIEIRSQLQSALTELNVAMSGDERLQVPAAVARLRLANATAGEPARQTITVTPLTTGTHYLSVLLQAEIDGRLQSRSVTIPIRVDGASAAPAQGPVSTDAEGQPIISLPAREN